MDVQKQVSSVGVAQTPSSCAPCAHPSDETLIKVMNELHSAATNSNSGSDGKRAAESDIGAAEAAAKLDFEAAAAICRLLSLVPGCSTGPSKDNQVGLSKKPVTQQYFVCLGPHHCHLTIVTNDLYEPLHLLEGAAQFGLQSLGCNSSTGQAV